MDSINEYAGDIDLEIATSLLTLSLLIKSIQTITQIIQTIENSVHSLTSFGNFMND